MQLTKVVFYGYDRQLINNSKKSQGNHLYKYTIIKLWFREIYLHRQTLLIQGNHLYVYKSTIIKLWLGLDKQNYICIDSPTVRCMLKHYCQLK